MAVIVATYGKINSCIDTHTHTHTHAHTHTHNSGGRHQGGSGNSEDNRKSSMKSMLQRLALKVDKISRKTSTMDSTLGRVTSVLGYSE